MAQRLGEAPPKENAPAVPYIKKRGRPIGKTTRRAEDKSTHIYNVMCVYNVTERANPKSAIFRSRPLGTADSAGAHVPWAHVSGAQVPEKGGGALAIEEAPMPVPAGPPA